MYFEVVMQLSEETGSTKYSFGLLRTPRAVPDDVNVALKRPNCES